MWLGDAAGGAALVIFMIVAFAVVSAIAPDRAAKHHTTEIAATVAAR